MKRTVTIPLEVMESAKHLEMKPNPAWNSPILDAAKKMGLSSVDSYRLCPAGDTYSFALEVTGDAAESLDCWTVVLGAVAPSGE